MLDRKILPEIVERIAAHYNFEERPEIQEIEGIQCRYSEVFKTRVTAGDREQVLYIKMVTAKTTPGDPVKISVSREFEILRSLQDTFKSDADLGVPEAVAVWPEKNILITAEVEGPALMSLISRGTRRFAGADQLPDLDEQCRRCGLWLQRFQAATAQGTSPFDLEGLRSYCQVRLDVLSRKDDSRVGPAFRDGILRFLESEAARIPSAENRVTGRHNDFSPHNIIVQGDRIVTLDFGYFDHNSYAFDVYRYWHQLECMKFSPAFSRKKVSRLQQGFLQGFGQPVDLASPLFRVVGCRFYLTRLATAVDEGNRSGLRGLIDRQVYRACHDWLRHTCGLD